MRLPFFDSDASGVDPAVHYQHDFANGTSTFFNYQAGDETAYKRKEDQYYTVTRGTNAYKLAGETVNVPLNFAEEEDRDSEMTIVGNPFMATLSFTDLYDANLNTIKNGYQIWTGDYENAGYKGYNTTGGGFGLVTTDDLDEFIAPMQAFIVEKNDSYSSGDLAYTISMTNAAAASELRSSTVETGKKITLTASNSAGAYRTVIAEREEGSELLSNLDSRILMNSVGNLPVIYSIKPSESGAAYLGANMLPAGDREIPIGLWTNYSGELNLTFAGMDSYNTGITFVDHVTGEETDLTGRSSYTCTVAIAPETANRQALALNDRFVLRLAQVTQPTDLPVVSNSLIGQASVYNLQGQLLHRIPASKLYNLPAGIYLVRLTNGTEVKTVKMILSNKH